MKKYIIASIITATAACALYAQTAPAVQKTAPAEQKAAAAVKVEKIVTAASVENREPVNETAAFDKTAGRVYTWTKITAEAVPTKVKHIYYADGKKAFEIELAVNASPYRVWSSKAVWPGNWKVEVTDEAGSVISTVEFTVSDTKAAAEPAKAEATKKAN